MSFTAGIYYTEIEGVFLDIPSIVGRDVEARKQCIVSRINGNMIGFD
jgi:hypothetical protein